MAQTKPQKCLVPTSEAAAYLGVAPLTVRRMIAAGKIKGYRVGHQIRVDLNAIDANLTPIPAATGGGGRVAV